MLGWEGDREKGILPLPSLSWECERRILGAGTGSESEKMLLQEEHRCCETWYSLRRGRRDVTYTVDLGKGTG